MTGSVAPTIGVDGVDRIESETRMLVTDGDGRHRWVSPTLERSFMWGGEIRIPEDLPVEQRSRLQQVCDEVTGGRNRDTKPREAGRA